MEYNASATKHLLWFVETKETARLLMDHPMDEDRLDLAKKVERSLSTLCDEALVQKNGDEYTFLTNLRKK